MIQSLVLIEHDGQRVKRASLAAITLAQQLGGTYALLVLGSGIANVVASLQHYGADSVQVADHEMLSGNLADRSAAVTAKVVRQLGASHLLGTASSHTKDVLPRVAALLDAVMLTDVMAVENREGEICYRHPVCAGSLIETVVLVGGIRVLTARGTSFASPPANDQACPLEPVPVDAGTLPGGMQFISREAPTSTRPDLIEARVVVCGGRPLKDKETFERLIGGLADALGGAIGATRAAVDAGMALNDCQVGQTGRTIAPELYFGIGISGAIQHLAGIKDSRIIVAINRDPEAPIFQVANYGLVGDLHQILPQLIASVHS